MLNSLVEFCSPEGFMPHGHCYLWSEGLLWLHVISDVLITLSYFSIPFTLLYFVRKRTDVELDWIIVCFAVFIVACAFTHLLEIVAVWHPIYWVTGSAKAVTALASVPTAILLVRLVPYAIKLPSPTELKMANQALTNEVDEHRTSKSNLETTHRKLVDASRQAGMAEVATEVLHNIGNVLNSVNVSASVVGTRMRRFNVSDLERVSALLNQPADGLASYLTEDPKGKVIPEYLHSLTRSLQVEREEILEELKNLEKNIEHIKDIVSMQQDYAKSSIANENVSVVDLLEDSLRLNAEGFVRHDVKITRNFESHPVISIDKHKVLQIFVNLIKNANHACEESGRVDKNVTVGLVTEDSKVVVTVTDNGVGIPPENLARIFNHGFTTRERGHGFGLHSSANTARELGGSLVAHSDGPGQGATFTFTLPNTRQGPHS